eukprot:5469884-Amphidinium_carterae.1
MAKYQKAKSRHCEVLLNELGQNKRFPFARVDHFLTMLPMTSFSDFAEVIDSGLRCHTRGLWRAIRVQTTFKY